MKTTAFTTLLLMTASTSVSGQTYDWLDWTFPVQPTATAEAAGFGSIHLSVSGAPGQFVRAGSAVIEFPNVPFTPTLAPVARANGGFREARLGDYEFTIDLSAYADTSNLVVGFGNFGHNAPVKYPGYRLSAWDTDGDPMALTALTQLGSYDHVLFQPNGLAFYNDDVQLNTTTGVFEVTTVPGQSDVDSDMILLALPSGVGLLTVETIAPSGPDSMFVMAAVVNSPPNCANATPSLDELWPPNHKFVPITIAGVTDRDGDPVTITIDSIFQDEPLEGLGDGTFSPDGYGIGTDTANLRAERSGTGDGRVYHVTFTATDGQGGECTETVSVWVPHSKNSGSVDQGPLFDSTE